MAAAGEIAFGALAGAAALIEVIRHIFEWYVREGLGFKGIATRLNRMGVPSPRGGYWSKTTRDEWPMTTIRDMLLNPVYIGDFVWNRLSFGKFHRIRNGRAVDRKALPGSGPEQNRPEDWIIIRDAHPPLISRALFEEAKAKRGDRRRHAGDHTYRSGRGATSPYLLSGLIHCTRCSHVWQGYTTQKGRKRADGSAVKTYYYGCGGYISKGNSVCQHSVISKEWIEGWVLEQINTIVSDYLDSGGEARVREIIEQELAGSSRFDGTELSRLRQRKLDIEGIIENLLDNITPTNRDYVDRRIEKLKDETVDLERQEASLLEQQNREAQVEEIAAQALALMREMPRLVEYGTTEEKRLVVRAFLQRIDFNPETKTGTAYFWSVPTFDPARGKMNPAGRGIRSDVVHSNRTPAPASGTLQEVKLRETATAAHTVKTFLNRCERFCEDSS